MLDAITKRKLTGFEDVAQFNDALSALEIVIGFLSSVGGDPHMKLNMYMADVLSMPHSQLFDKVSLLELMYEF